MTPVLNEGDIIGEYEIVRCLGGGAHDQLFEATYRPLGVRRALKALVAPPEMVAARRDAFLAESRLLAHLEHPRIVRIHDLAVDEERNMPYFTMDYVVSPDGSPRTLDEARRAGLSEQDVMRWFRDLCEGIDYLHSCGLVHRDITLANILIDAGGHAVITDFGLTRTFDKGISRFGDLSIPDEEIASGTRVGSVMYLSPEVRGGAAATPASDAWSLGVVLFRLITGYWFDASDRDLYLQMTEYLDAPWRKAEEVLLSPDPGARIPAKGLVELARVVEDGYVPLETRVERMIRRERCVIAAASVAVAAALGAGVWFAASPRPAPSPAPDVPAECGEPGVLALPCPDPSARRWDDRASNGYAALDESIVLANLDRFPPEVADAIRHALEHTVSYYGCEPSRSNSDTDRIAEWVDSEIAAGKGASANPAQLLLAAGEIYRQRQMFAPGGDLRVEEERLAELAVRFLAFASERGLDAGWCYETILSDAVAGCGRALDMVRKSDPVRLVPADEWLLRMLSVDGDTLASVVLRRDRAPDEMGRGERAECADLVRTARMRLHEAALAGKGGHTMARHALRLAIGDAAAVSDSFSDCLRHAFDDLRDWDRCAISLLPRWGAPKGAVEEVLDLALDAGTDDSWLPAFYVLGRWRILARYAGPEGWNADADHRAWAYEDAEVREKTLSVIRSFKDSPLLANAPGMRRLAVTANFAAVALVCGDEPLARELVGMLPRDWSRFLVVMREAASPESVVFARLDAIRVSLGEEGGA